MYRYKLVTLVFIFAQNIYANSENFDANCKNCHFAQNQLEMFMNRYTLKYSSEKRVKNAIFEFLKNPKQENSVMPIGFLNRFGLKEATVLDDKTLIDSINEYYEVYNLKRKIE